MYRSKVNYFVHHYSRPSVAAYGYYLRGRQSHYHFHYQQQQQQQQQPSRDASHCLAALFFSRFATQCYFNRPAMSFSFVTTTAYILAVATGKSSPAPGCAAYYYTWRGLMRPFTTQVTCIVVDGVIMWPGRGLRAITTHAVVWCSLLLHAAPLAWSCAA